MLILWEKLFKPHDFASCQRAMPAIEAAIFLPILIILSLSLTEIAHYAMTIRAVARVAVLQAQQLTRFDGDIPAIDAEVIAQTARVLLPRLPVDYKKVFQSTAAQVSFEAVDPDQVADGACLVAHGCKVRANVDLTIQWNDSTWVRSCGAVKLLQGSSENSLLSIPQSAADMTIRGLGSVIVVDVRYVYEPFYRLTGLAGWTINRQAIAVPRYLQSERIDPVLNGSRTNNTSYKLCSSS